MRLGIIGSRTLKDTSVNEVITQVISKSKTPITEIVSGGAAGVDAIAEQYAKLNNIKLKVFKPKYNEHGKAATFIRNNEIVKNSDGVLAIWDGQSKGTQYTINKAKKENKKVMIVKI